MDLEQEFEKETGFEVYDKSNVKYNGAYVEWLEGQIEQLRIGGVVGRSEQFYCQCDMPETDPLNPYSDDCYKCGDKLQ